MTTIRRKPPHYSNGTHGSNSSNTIVRIVLCSFFACIFGFMMLFLLSSSSSTSTTDSNDPTTLLLRSLEQQKESRATRLRGRIQDVMLHKRKQIINAFQSLNKKSKDVLISKLPARIRILRDKNEIIGERLNEIRVGKTSVHEILHGHNIQQNVHLDASHYNALRPMDLKEVISYLDGYIHQLHDVLGNAKHETFEGVWQAYHDLTIKTLYPWDRQYIHRMPKRKTDGSVFLSVATYRDENCFNTIYNAYAKAKYPEKLFIGLVQQNCHKNCKSGVLANITMVDVPPDDNCYIKFCESDIGKDICAKEQVRLLDIDEPESLGPYAARYFASKLWYGESWYMQIDAHMTFAQYWDEISINMLQKAPSAKPILSHYPPSNTYDFEAKKFMPSSRLCGPVFATSDLESQVIRLEGAGIYDKVQLEYPSFAPFTAAGYFVAHSDFLREVPFDPFLPWIFMGEEIIMSSRLWTAGYDIFAPNEAVVGHFYVRRHMPKFWESVHRAFTNGIHNPLQMLVLERVKYQLGYPEASRDMLRTKSILTAVEQYGMGKARPLEEYLRIVGMNMTTKQMTSTKWCEEGRPPPGFEQYNQLYPAGREYVESLKKKKEQE